MDILSSTQVNNGSTTDISNTSTYEILHVEDDSPYSILFLFCSIALGAFVRDLHKKIRLPYTVVLLVCGALFGIISSRHAVLQNYTALGRIDPHIILHVFLPILIFESAFAMDVHTFRRCFLQCVLLAVPGLVLSTGLIATLSVNLFISYQWDWPVAFLFGSILSATDPVAVVALLRELGTSKSLSTVIEGESLLNDGSAIVAFTILMDLIIPGSSVSAPQVVIMFCRISLGGPALGFVVGRLAVFCLSHIFNDAVIEITVTLSAAYVTYYLAEVVLHVSGVLALVTLGVVVSSEKSSISPEVEGFVHRFWEMLSYLANTVIFIVVGVVITESAYGFIRSEDWFLILATYIGTTVFRLLMISVLSPALCRLGYGLCWQEVVVMTWGGLRGAVSLALALSVTRKFSDEELIGSKILIHVAGIVTLTLLINATTIKYLLKLLGMSVISQQKRSNMAIAVNHLKEIQKRSLQVQRSSQLLGDADWKYVEKLTTIDDPYLAWSEDQDGVNQTTPYTPLRNSVCPGCSTEHPVEPTPRELHQFTEEARKRMIMAQKMSYWRQFEHGVLGRENVRVLVAAADVAADKDGGFITVEDLRNHWQVHGIVAWLKKKLERNRTQGMRNRYSSTVDVEARADFWQKLFVVTTHPAFGAVISMAVVVNLAFLILEVVSYVHELDKTHTVARWTFRYTNIGFIIAYIIEACLKILGQRWKTYWSCNWNKVDFVVLIVQVLDMIIEITFYVLDLEDIEKSISYLFASRSIRLFRAARLFRVFQYLASGILLFVNNWVNRQLYAGYDIGCGFLTGEEDVMKIVHEITDYPAVADKLRQRCEDNRLQIVTELARLQQEYPSVAMAVKSCHAARQILNNIREELNELKEAGLLVDSVHESLLAIIEKRMKNLMNSPTSLLPAPPVELLKHVNWIEGCHEIYKFIKSKAKVVKFPKGWTLCVEGDPPSGIHVITVGLIKVNGAVVSSEDGSLPNTDTFHWFSKDGDFEDRLSVGNVLGELGVVTKKPHSTRAICETEVQAFHIRQEDMLEAIRQFDSKPSLEYRLWRSCALRTAKHILRNNHHFEDWSSSQIMMHLSRAYIPDLSDTYNFEAGPEVEDAILVQGVAQDTLTNEIYKGAIYIPRSVRSLSFQESAIRSLLVIVGTRDYVLPPSLDWSGGLDYRKEASFQAKPRRRRKSKSWMSRSPSVWSAPNVAALPEANRHQPTSRCYHLHAADEREEDKSSNLDDQEYGHDNPVIVVEEDTLSASTTFSPIREESSPNGTFQRSISSPEGSDCRLEMSVLPSREQKL